MLCVLEILTTPNHIYINNIQVDYFYMMNNKIIQLVTHMKFFHVQIKYYKTHDFQVLKKICNYNPNHQQCI